MNFKTQSIHFLWRLKQRFIALVGGKTMGARALVIKKDQILLVRHTYGQGWFSVGGTVDFGETPLQCLERELQEEVEIVLQKMPPLIGIYYNNFEGRQDYVALYLVQDFEMEGEEGEVGEESEMGKMGEVQKMGDVRKTACPEVAEKRWFSLSNLPEDISPGTLRRVEEFLGMRKQTEIW